MDHKLKLNSNAIVCVVEKLTANGSKTMLICAYSSGFSIAKAFPEQNHFLDFDAIFMKTMRNGGLCVHVHRIFFSFFLSIFVICFRLFLISLHE